MDCEKFKEYLDNYANLTNDEKLEMNEHAAHCEQCREEMDFFLSIIAVSASLPQIEPPVDFMDKLNERIDKEERSAANIARKLAANVRKNWKQYTAAAACFALIVTVTANRSMFMDVMDNDSGDTGVITEVTDSGNVSDNQPLQDAVIQSDEANIPDIIESAPEIAHNAENTHANTQSGAAVKTPKTQTAAVVTENKQSTNIIPSVKPSINTTIEPQITDSHEQAADTAQTAAEGYSIDENSAIATADAQNSKIRAYDPSDDGISAQSENAAVGYSLSDESESIARGVCHKLDKDGNPVETDDNPKAIGKLQISTSEPDKAMEVIRQYSFSKSGNMYITDSENLSLLLSGLNREGIRYTDYTLSGSGSIQFEIVFN